MYAKADEGVLNCVDIVVHDIEAWRKEAHQDHGDEVINARYHGWFSYVVLGRLLTMLSDVKLKWENRRAKKMANKKFQPTQKTRG